MVPSIASRTSNTAQPWPRSFDIFCRVIDNYGDIGVCWRLALQLASHPRKFRVRLWVDDLQRCRSLVPEVDITLQRQLVRGIELVHWTQSTPSCPLHDVVIEAFACDPPAEILARMTPTHAWINLDYLSAESWVEDCHGLQSPQANGLKKFFFFPGFTAATGGLLREPDLLARRNSWQAQPILRWHLLQDMGLPSDAIGALQQGARQVFLFCYPHAPVESLLKALAAKQEQHIILLPEGVAPNIGTSLPSCMQIQRIPFVPQDVFDTLLWSSDLNCIRGEDSLVRGLWAGRPLLWHIYAQDEDVHLQKLDAWLARSPYPAKVQTLMRGWNQTSNHVSLPSLSDSDWQTWQTSASQWTDRLFSKPDLISSLLSMLRAQNASA